jgi:hypothetical protein
MTRIKRRCRDEFPNPGFNGLREWLATPSAGVHPVADANWFQSTETAYATRLRQFAAMSTR